jgi:hypothetical protein
MSAQTPRLYGESHAHHVESRAARSLAGLSRDDTHTIDGARMLVWLERRGASAAAVRFRLADWLREGGYCERRRYISEEEGERADAALAWLVVCDLVVIESREEVAFKAGSDDWITARVVA